MKQVYVILLNWNGWRDTLECLDSLDKLDYPNYRILVVDNASTNDSVVQIHLTYPDVPLLVNDRNLGFGGGCNVGIQRALQSGADYVWLLNNDTKVDPHALTALVEKAESNSEIGAVGSVLYHMGEPGRVQAWGGGYVNLWLGVSRHHFVSPKGKRMDYLTAASLLLRGEALDQVGGFDEGFFMYWEDSDLGFRLRKEGWQLAVAEDSLIWHKESASLGKENPVLLRYFSASAIRFFRKHTYFSLIPILVGVGGRFVKRLVQGDWKEASSVLKGACDRRLYVSVERMLKRQNKR